MAKVKVVGVQAFVAGYDMPPIGSLVSGVTSDGTPVLALAAHDSEGRFFIAFNGPAGTMSALTDTELASIQVVDGELLIEPADNSVPYALPSATPTEGAALIVAQGGTIGVQVAVPQDDGKPFVWAANIATGEPMPPGRRWLLRGFKMLLQVKGRDKPFAIGEF